MKLILVALAGVFVAWAVLALLMAWAEAVFRMTGGSLFGVLIYVSPFAAIAAVTIYKLHEDKGEK